MKEQWKTEEKLVALEEGRKQQEQEYVKEHESGVNRCKKPMQCIKLVLYIELILFLGWGCYMILQIYRSEIMGKEIADIVRERDLSTQSTVNPNAEMPMILMKSNGVLNELNRFLEDIKLIKEQDLKQDDVIKIDDAAHSNTQDPVIDTNVQSDNMARSNNVNSLLLTSLLLDLKHSEESIDNSVPWKIYSTGYIDEINTSKEEDDNVFNSQIFNKLQDIMKSKLTNDFEKFIDKHDFTENTDSSTLNTEENRKSNTLDKIENLGFDAMISSDFDDPINLKVSVINSSPNLKPELFDTIQDVAQEKSSEISSFRDKNDEYVKEMVYPQFLWFPSSHFHESSDESKHLVIDSSNPDSVSMEKIFEPIDKQKDSNLDNDAVARNGNEHKIHNKNVLMSISSDVSTSNSDEPRSSFDKMMKARNTGQHSSEITADTKNDEESESAENIQWINPFIHLSLQPETQSNDESSIPNDNQYDNPLGFQWFIPPAKFANELPAGPNNLPKSSETQKQLPLDKETGVIEDLIPGNKCYLEIKMDILRVTCPTIKFDEEWNLSSSENHVPDVPDIIDYGDISDDYYTECDEDTAGELQNEVILGKNSDIIKIPQQNSPNMIDTSGVQDSIPDVKTSDIALSFADLPETKIDSFDSTKNKQEATVNNPNEEEIEHTAVSESSSNSQHDSRFEIDSDIVFPNKEWHSSELLDTQQQKQLEITEKQDFSSVEQFAPVIKLSQEITALEEILTSIVKDDILNVVRNQNTHLNSFFEAWDEYLDSFCSDPHKCSEFSNTWRQQYISDLRTFLQNIRNGDFPDDLWNDSNYRKKRTVKNQQEQISNALEENNISVDVLHDAISEEENSKNIERNLRRLFQKMEILAARIDALHERYLRVNKLDDDYVSNEFPTEEHQ